MDIPFFYIENLESASGSIPLSEETSRHVVQVLRMKTGEQLQLTNGKGKLVTAIIADDHKKKAVVTMLQEKIFPAPERKNTIAISLVKNASRFEWFLEKATENGIAAIIPLICSRTEKQHFRTDRMKNILISAMLQSQQVWLPEMHEPQSFLTYISAETASQKFIAHCEPDKEKMALSKLYKPGMDSSILIGPEGDFTAAEIKSALEAGFVPVALGETRLRTETAGLAAAVLLQQL